MGDAWSIGHADLLQFDLVSASMLEQPDTFTEQHWHEVKINFVQESSLDVLLDCVRTTQNNDVFLTCGSSRFFKGAFDTVRDEGI